jgi:hypothetical protein
MGDHSCVFADRENNLKRLLNIVEYFKVLTFRICLTNPNVIREKKCLQEKLFENHKRYLLIKEFLDKDSKLYYGPNRSSESKLSCVEFCCNLSLKSVIALSTRLLESIKLFESSGSELSFLKQSLFCESCYHYKFNVLGSDLEINNPRDWLIYLHIIPFFMCSHGPWVNDPELGLQSKDMFIEQMYDYLSKLYGMLTLPQDLINTTSDCQICERDRIMVGLLDQNDYVCTCISIPFYNKNEKGGNYSEQTNILLDENDSLQRLTCLKTKPCCDTHKELFMRNLLTFKNCKTMCHKFMKI